MAALFCVGVIAALGPPVEVVIDCSSWTGAKVTQVRVQFESWDGKVVTDLFECADMTDPTCPRGALRIILRDAGWRFHYLDNYRDSGPGVERLAGAQRVVRIGRVGAGIPVRPRSAHAHRSPATREEVTPVQAAGRRGGTGERGSAARASANGTKS